MIFLGRKKAEIMFLIFSDIKFYRTDISEFARGNSDLCLQCFKIFSVHVQVFEHKIS